MDNVYKFSTIKEMLNNSLEKFADRPAYKIENRVITYKELKNTVNYLGTELVNMGLKGKRIAIIGQNSYNWEISYLAIVCGAGIVVPLDKMLPENELESLIERSKVEAIIFDDKYDNARGCPLLSYMLPYRRPARGAAARYP